MGLGAPGGIGPGAPGTGAGPSGYGGFSGPVSGGGGFGPIGEPGGWLGRGGTQTPGSLYGSGLGFGAFGRSGTNQGRALSVVQVAKIARAQNIRDKLLGNIKGAIPQALISLLMGDYPGALSSLSGGIPGFPTASDIIAAIVKGIFSGGKKGSVTDVFGLGAPIPQTAEMASRGEMAGLGGPGGGVGEFDLGHPPAWTPPAPIGQQPAPNQPWGVSAAPNLPGLASAPGGVVRSGTGRGRLTPLQQAVTPGLDLSLEELTYSGRKKLRKLPTLEQGIGSY